MADTAPTDLGLWGEKQAISILETLKPVHDRLVQDGRIDLRLQHRLCGLLTDRRGAVTGVRATTPNGEFEFRGRNVVLACGGYAFVGYVFGAASLLIIFRNLVMHCLYFT